MSGFDGTGPQGKGPMTGRSMGFCMLKESKDKPSQMEGFVGIQGVLVNQYGSKLSHIAARPMYGRGYGRGFGCGRGFRGGRGRIWPL